MKIYNLNIFLDYLYESPLKSKKVIGVTGTDGKTSTCHLIAECLTALGKRVGIISTEGNGVYPRLKQSKYTTPRSDILYEEFSIFRDKNVDTVIIECSSQGLDQGRLNNIIFTYSVITNIHKDHIEYHKTFKNYVESKIKLLNMTKKHFFINEEIPSGPKPSINLPSQNFHKKRPIFLHGLINITSYSSSKYHLLIKKLYKGLLLLAI